MGRARKGYPLMRRLMFKVLALSLTGCGIGPDGPTG